MAEQGQRAASTLTQLQRFFAHHLLDMYGCDYSSSGLTSESIASKLRSFFQRQTGDGPRFGTYLVYYSGHVHENGDWALAGKWTVVVVRKFWLDPRFLRMDYRNFIPC